MINFLRNSTGTPLTSASGGRPPGNRNGLTNLLGGGGRRPDRESERPLSINVAAIGRSHAGKSAMLMALSRQLVDEYLPSGLFFGGGDPREVAGRLQRLDEQIRDLQRDGLASTLEETELVWQLCEGEFCRMELRTNETIGQVLEFTRPDSPPEMQERYSGYLDRLRGSDVLWVVMSCPPAESSGRDHDRFQRDLRLTAAYLREALRRHGSGRPCSVALCLTKIDQLYADDQAARAELSEEVLQQALSPLVRTVETFGPIAHAAIFPVSSFGFGQARLRDEVDEELQNGFGDDDPDDLLPLRNPDEPEYVLRPDGTARPFNIDSLLIWSLLAGALPQEVVCPEGSEPDAARTARMLSEDLATLGGWIVPLKGSLS